MKKKIILFGLAMIACSSLVFIACPPMKVFAEEIGVGCPGPNCEFANGHYYKTKYLPKPPHDCCGDSCPANDQGMQGPATVPF